ncbi:extensin [Streptomyces cyslabdanicus]|uniref:extensin n=1 Tax=Streptomyces cyslabdanicus TaxID=1470456 RepID=UPI004043F947
MAEEQHGWLDRDTAERLLRGEPLDTVDITARHQAERLAKALGALSAESYPPPLAARAFPDPAASPASSPAPAYPADAADAALPGEATALAAFRKARAQRADERAAEETGAGPRPFPAVSDDVGLVRIGTHARGGRGGRPRRAGPRHRGRPVRLAVSAALAAGAVGGVAAAATTGVLPTPFGGDEPAPGTSVSVPAAPERPLVSPSPGGSTGGGPGTPTPGGATAGAPDGDTGSTAREDGAAPGHDASAGSGDGQGALDDGGKGLVSSCRDLRDGRSLDSDRRRDLEGAAGGSARVWTYCRGVLKAADGRSGGKGGGDRGENQGGQNGQSQSSQSQNGQSQNGQSQNGQSQNGQSQNGQSQSGQSGQSGGKGQDGQGEQGDDQGGDPGGDRDGRGGDDRGLRKSLAPMAPATRSPSVARSVPKQPKQREQPDPPSAPSPDPTGSAL